MTGQEFLGLLAFIAIYSIGTIAAIGSGLWITATYPRAMDSVQRLYRGRNFRCLLVGIVNTIILLALFLLLTKSPPLKLLGVLIGIVLVFLVISGLSVAFLDLGRRLLPDQVGDNTIRPVIVGGLVLAALLLTPIFGQIVFVTLTLRGVGAVVLNTLAGNLINRDSAVPSPPSAE